MTVSKFNTLFREFNNLQFKILRLYFYRGKITPKIEKFQERQFYIKSKLMKAGHTLIFKNYNISPKSTLLFKPGFYRKFSTISRGELKQLQEEDKIMLIVGVIDNISYALNVSYTYGRENGSMLELPFTHNEFDRQIEGLVILIPKSILNELEAANEDERRKLLMINDIKKI